MIPLGQIGTHSWVKCRCCGCMTSVEGPTQAEECPGCGEIVDADEYNGGQYQFECHDCGTIWQH